MCFFVMQININLMLMANQIGERGLQLDDDHLGLVTMTAKVIDAKHFWSDDGQYHKFPTKPGWQYQLSLISLFPSDGFNPQMRPELSASLRDFKAQNIKRCCFCL